MDDNDPDFPSPRPAAPAADMPMGVTADNPFNREQHIALKGDYFDLKKKVPSLNELAIAAGWEHVMFEEQPLDVDLSVFLLNKGEQTREDSDFVFYNNLSACAGAVRSLGDSRTGAGDGDDEVIVCDLNGLPFDVMKIAITLTLYDAVERGHHFGMLRNMYVRFVNGEDEHEIFRYPIPEADFEGHIGIKVGELVREGPKWFFHAIGEPIPGGLGSIAVQYGMLIQSGQG